MRGNTIHQSYWVDEIDGILYEFEIKGSTLYYRPLLFPYYNFAWKLYKNILVEMMFAGSEELMHCPIKDTSLPTTNKVMNEISSNREFVLFGDTKDIENLPTNKYNSKRALSKYLKPKTYKKISWRDINVN